MAQIQKNSWLRAWARFCDYCLLFLLLGIISLFLPLFYDPLFYLFMAVSIPFLWIPLEAFSISKWGTTFGKRFFGIRIQKACGSRLSYLQALKRALFISPRPGIAVQKKLPLFRSLFAVLFTLTCFAFGLFGNLITQWGTGVHQAVVTDGWVKFESEKADFKIYFPDDPQQESKEIILPNTGKVMKYEQITHENEEILYSVTHMTIPNKWKLAGNATLLKLSLEGIIKHSKDVELLEKQFIMHQGHRALDYMLTEEGKRVKGRLVLIGNTIYRLTVVYPLNLKDQVESHLFLDSFVPF